MGTRDSGSRLKGVRLNVRLPKFSSVLVLLLVASAAIASAQSRFSETLMPADWAAAGMAHLSAEQTAALDNLIQHDVEAARQGDVVAFAKSFSERRSPEEWQRAGLDRLNPTERARLDSVVARIIATRPAVAFAPAPATGAPLREIKTLPRPWEVHGDVTMFVGGGSGGRSWYGGGMDVYATDPSGHLTVGVGMSEVRGKGLGWGCSRAPLW